MNKKLLEQFFKEIAELTLDHSVYGGVAAVSAQKLGDALEKVDNMWWKNCKKSIDNDVE